MTFIKRLVVAAMLLILAAAGSSFAAELSIFNDYNAFQGHPETISIKVNNLDFDLGRFDLLLAVNEGATAIIKVEPGQTLLDCGYEYFTYNVIIDSLGLHDLGSFMVVSDTLQYFEFEPFTTLIEIHGILASDSPYPCPTQQTPLSLADLTVLTTFDRKYECFYIPVSFYWRDCFDNALYSRTGDLVQLADSILMPDGWALNATPLFTYPGFGVPDQTCDAPGGLTAQRGMNVKWGGFDFVCTDCGCYSGDINMDRFRYSVSDFRLFSNYFLNGLGVFHVNVAGQIAASDINCDGNTLELPDLWTLHKVMTADAFVSSFILNERCGSAAKLGPAEITATASLAIENGAAVLKFSSDIPVGALYAQVTCRDANATAAPLKPGLQIGRFDNTVTVLGLGNELQSTLGTGPTELLRVNDEDATLTHIEALGADGYPLKVDIIDELPASFALMQNYPNPFNPSTTISFTLPHESDWTVKIFNIAGQLVETMNGHAQGSVSVKWNAGNNASGVYFYRLNAGSFDSTNRMLLLK